MKALGKLVLTALGALAIYWVLSVANMPETTKLGLLLFGIVLWVNYETNTAKDRIADLEWRIDEIERNKSRY